MPDDEALECQMMRQVIKVLLEDMIIKHQTKQIVGRVSS